MLSASRKRIFKSSGLRCTLTLDNWCCGRQGDDGCEEEIAEEHHGGDAFDLCQSCVLAKENKEIEWKVVSGMTIVSGTRDVCERWERMIG